MTYPEALRLLFMESYGIAVAGTHGKSTTTAMLGVILEKAGLDPTVIVGTRVTQWGSNARVGNYSRFKILDSRFKLFVAEADEYREAFLHYEPQGLIITSIEYDHPDYFKTFAAYKNAFRKLVKKVPLDGFIVANFDDPQVRDAVKSAKCKIVPYGFTKNHSKKFTLLVPGDFNQLNALAAASVAETIGVKTVVIKKALAGFRGTTRRFEIKSSKTLLRYQRYRPIIVDDYAHHPSEIKATLKTARELWPKKEIWVIFQPHTYSRTEALLNDFAKSFFDADRVFILETYASAREKRGKIGVRELAKTTAKYHPSVHYLSSIPLAVRALKKQLNYLLKPITYNLVVITMGAGDVWQVGEKLLTE